MIDVMKLARAEEWLSNTDMTITEAARALDVDAKNLQISLNRVRKRGFCAMSQIHCALDEFGSLTSKKIGQMLSFSQAHVTNNLKTLIDLGEVEKVGGKIPLYKSVSR